MLTEPDPYTLAWLHRALTLPGSYTADRYYYDRHRHDFFQTEKNDRNPYVCYLDRHHTEYPIDIGIDLAVRLEFVHDDSSDLIELPRFTVGEKITLQLEFLASLPPPYWANELVLAVEQQPDEPGYILDTLLTGPTKAHWSEHQLQLTLTCMKRLVSLLDQ